MKGVGTYAATIESTAQKQRRLVVVSNSVQNAAAMATFLCAVDERVVSACYFGPIDVVDGEACRDVTLGSEVRERARGIGRCDIAGDGR